MTSEMEAKCAFYKALSAAQSEIEGAIKNSTNPHFRSKYADLGAVWEACRAPLTKHGLSVIQCPSFEPDRGVVVVTTILAHEGGYETSFPLTMPVSKVDAQGVGSAISYARRYALMAAVGIAPEDDDGNAAVAQGDNHKAPRVVGERAPGKPTAGAAKPAWAGFIAKLESFTDAEECARWFDSAETQNKINSWPRGDMGDWAELAADHFDKHMQKLYGTVAA